MSNWIKWLLLVSCFLCQSVRADWAGYCNALTAYYDTGACSQLSQLLAIQTTTLNTFQPPQACADISQLETFQNGASTSGCPLSNASAAQTQQSNQLSQDIQQMEQQQLKQQQQEEQKGGGTFD